MAEWIAAAANGRSAYPQGISVPLSATAAASGDAIGLVFTYMSVCLHHPSNCYDLSATSVTTPTNGGGWGGPSSEATHVREQVGANAGSAAFMSQGSGGSDAMWAAGDTTVPTKGPIPCHTAEAASTWGMEDM